MRRFILTGLLVVAGPIVAQSSELDPPSSDGDPVSLPGTHTFMVTPLHGDEPYEVRVALPLSYAAAPEKRYPVLYLTDGDVVFASATEISRVLALNDLAPEQIVVGIGYGSRDPKEWGRRRSLDLTPRIDSAGPERFLTFLTEQLIPLVESRYRVLPERTFWGYSVGGQFGTWLLLRHPGIFQRYILGSPSYRAWGVDPMLGWADALRGSQPPAARVYTSRGKRESLIESWARVWDAIEAAAPPEIEVVRSQPDVYHGNGWWSALSQGIPAVFQSTEHLP